MSAEPASRTPSSPPAPAPAVARGLSPGAAAAAFLALALAPLLIALASGEEPGGWHEETGIALGLAALALLLLQFAHAGRWTLVSGRTGIDTTMRFHRAAAILLLGLALLHPVLFLAPALLRDPGAGLTRLHALFESPRMTSGRIALVALALTVALALARQRLRYPLWRLTHGLTAILAAAAAVWHALEVGLYSAFAPLAALWWAGLAGAAALLAWSWAWKPWRLARAGHRLAAVTPLSPEFVELRLEGPVPPFQAGQFAWLAFGRAAPWDDNPFSMASAPGEPSLRFVVQEVGDGTRRIARLPPGTPVRVDGPHGAFTLARAGPGPLLLAAGGAGIAPILSIARHLEAAGDTRPVALLQAARTPERLVAREEMAARAARLGWRACFLAEKGALPGVEEGKPEPARLAALLRGWAPGEVTAFLCGPTPMMMALARALEELGVPPERIVYERFDYA